MYSPSIGLDKSPVFAICLGLQQLEWVGTEWVVWHLASRHVYAGVCLMDYQLCRPPPGSCLDYVNSNKIKLAFRFTEINEKHCCRLVILWVPNPRQSYELTMQQPANSPSAWNTQLSKGAKTWHTYRRIEWWKNPEATNSSCRWGVLYWKVPLFIYLNDWYPTFFPMGAIRVAYHIWNSNKTLKTIRALKQLKQKIQNRFQCFSTFLNPCKKKLAPQAERF